VVHRTGHSFPDFWEGPESIHPHEFGMLYYGVGALHDVMGSLAGTYADLNNNPPHRSLRTLRHIVRLDMWTF
jgi:hypothetical protein